MNDPDLPVTLARVRADLPRLRLAVMQRAATGTNPGFITGSVPSWEPIRLAAFALIEDMTREAEIAERALRAELGHTYRRAPRLEDAMTNLAVAWHGSKLALGATLAAQDAVRVVQVWDDRLRLVLGELVRPYPLLWPDASAVRCPVVEWVADQAQAVECRAPLMAHRDVDGSLNYVRCSRRSDDHAWRVGVGWLRLRRQLDGAA